jgi:hypothetical protein
MTKLERILTPAREAGILARERAHLATHGTTRGPGWLGATTMALGAAGAGAVAAFLLDPARGRARRAQLTDQAAATVRRLGRRGEQAARRARAAVNGRIQALRAASDRMPKPTDDATVTDRVRSEIFRDPSVPKGSININVERGIVVLRGEVPDEAMRHQLVDRVERIEGVWSVHDLLHAPGEAAPTTREPVASA